MSPEQLAGNDLTPRADVWALAMVLWELMASALPWAGLLSAAGPAALDTLRAAIRRGDRPAVPSPPPAEYPEPYVAAIRAGMRFEVRPPPPHSNPTRPCLSPP